MIRAVVGRTRGGVVAGGEAFVEQSGESGDSGERAQVGFPFLQFGDGSGQSRIGLSCGR